MLPLEPEGRCGAGRGSPHGGGRHKGLGVNQCQLLVSYGIALQEGAVTLKWPHLRSSRSFSPEGGFEPGAAVPRGLKGLLRGWRDERAHGADGGWWGQPAQQVQGSPLPAGLGVLSLLPSAAQPGGSRG